MTKGLILIDPPITEANIKQILALIKLNISVEIAIKGSNSDSNRIVVVGAPGRNLTTLEKLKQTAVLDQILVASEAKKLESDALELLSYEEVLVLKKPPTHNIAIKPTKNSFYLEKHNEKILSKKANQLYKRYKR